MDERWISTADAADRLGCHPTRLTQMREAERLQTTKDGRRLYYWRPEIDALLQRRASGQKSPATVRPVSSTGWLAEMVAEDQELGLRRGTRHTYAAARKMQLDADVQAGLLIEIVKVEAGIRDALAALTAVLSPDAVAAARGWDADEVAELQAQAYDQVLTAWQRALDG